MPTLEGANVSQNAWPLVTSRPSYVGGMVNILAPPWAWSSHQGLAEVVRRGGTTLEQHAET